MQGIIDEPCRIPEALGMEVVQMERQGVFSTWCRGGGGVVEVDRILAVVVSSHRIRDAGAVGVETRVTACPACQPTLLRGAGRVANELDQFIDVPSLRELLDEALDEPGIRHERPGVSVLPQYRTRLFPWRWR
jgi:Fe-S oxidoreductase